METGYIVDVLANVRKIKTGDMNFGQYNDYFLNFVEHIAKGASRIDLVFHSYLERTIRTWSARKGPKNLLLSCTTLSRKPTSSINGLVLAFK